MTEQQLLELRYPIGKFKAPKVITPEHLDTWIATLEQFPVKLEALVKHMSKAQLDTPYRPEGWTVRQVVHHLSDSHHHSYIRFKWALTENKPVIKYYYENLWAELVDSKMAPIQMSLEHLKAVHYKLVYLLKRLDDEQWDRSFIHPEHDQEVHLRLNAGIYAWHSEHHYMHIKNLVDRKGW